MKVYARQVNPEYQESPLFIDEYWHDEIAVTGNRRMKDYTFSAFDQLQNIGECIDQWEKLKTNKDNSWYKNLTDIINDLLPGKTKYTTRQIHKFKLIFEQYPDARKEDETELDMQVLSLMTGHDYVCQIIRGSSQSEWNYLYFPQDVYNQAFVRNFEIEYWNEGSEWIIHDEPDEPKTADDINGYSCYCHAWNTDGIKKELADIAGCSIDDIVVYEYDGYIKTAKYKLVV